MVIHSVKRRGQKTEDRRQKTEDRRQKTEDRRQGSGLITYLLLVCCHTE